MSDFLSTMAARRSFSSVDGRSPDDAELARLLTGVVPVADHKGLRPWRMITHRGDERLELAAALARAKTDAKAGPDAEVTDKALDSARHKACRAPLLIAVLAVPHGHKVPDWEQEAVASGAAHLLSLALFEAGWGVMWRSGEPAGSDVVRGLYRLGPRDRLLGWLYIGGIEERYAERITGKPKKRPDPAGFLATLADVGEGTEPVDRQE